MNRNAMELYELVLFTTYFGQRCVNVFNYTMSGVPAAVSGSYGLIHAFGAIADAGVYPAGGIFAQLRALLNVSVSFDNIRVTNPYDATDFYSRPFPSITAGQTSGDGVSPTEAFSIRSNQVTRDIRAGQKRFVGVSESTISAGGVLTAPVLAAFTTLANTMSAPITYDDEGNTLTYNLVVVSKQVVTDPEGRVSREYYPTVTEQLAHTASGLLWTPRGYTSSQVTRQYNRGR